MTTIHSTIIDSLPGAAASDQYRDYIDSVEQALTEREYALTDQITIAVSQRFGVTEAQVRERLDAIGMAVRPAPAPMPDFHAFEAAMAAPNPVTAPVVAQEAPADESAPAKEKKAKKNKKSKTDKLVRKLVKAAKANGIRL